MVAVVLPSFLKSVMTDFLPHCPQKVWVGIDRNEINAEFCGEIGRAPRAELQVVFRERQPVGEPSRGFVVSEPGAVRDVEAKYPLMPLELQLKTPVAYRSERCFPQLIR